MANTIPTKVITGKVRLSYAKLNEPNDDGFYSTAVLIPKTDKETLSKIKQAVDAALERGKTELWKGKIPANVKKPLRDGDVEKEGDDTYAGMCFLNCKSKQKPPVVNKQLEPIVDADQIYSGMYANLSLTFYPFSKDGNNGVGCALNSVRKVADGDPLGGRSNPREDFADLVDDIEEGEDIDPLA